MTFQTDKPLAYAKMQKFDDMLKEGKIERYLIYLVEA